MTNEEIMQKWYNNELLSDELLDLARADERAKMQGVDVWVSWDNHHACGDVTASFKEPKANRNSDGSTYYNNYGAMSFDISEHAAKFLNIEPGQCKKFRIVEVLT